MSFKLRFIAATLFLVGMIGTAGYINHAKREGESLHDSNVPNALVSIILNDRARDGLHLIGFAIIGFLLGSWGKQGGSKTLSYGYAIVGGGLIEGVQFITARNNLKINLLLNSSLDMTVDIVGVMLGLYFLKRFLESRFGAEFVQ